MAKGMLVAPQPEAVEAGNAAAIKKMAEDAGKPNA